MANVATAPGRVFLTGGTGYLGSRLAAVLLARGHDVRALVRAGSEARLPPGCTAVAGDALDQRTYAAALAPGDTFVHLVGVPRPNPRKAAQFRSIDLAGAREGIMAARATGVRHFVYVSVAQPAPVMREYQAARAEAEDLLRASGLDATILRPWYVLGPGHWWPLLLVPLYLAAAVIPATRDGARRLGLVTIGQMVRALVRAVEQPAVGLRVIDVPEIRRP
jgi:uncharacterized protein YbjT (DUF2867 family)